MSIAAFPAFVEGGWRVGGHGKGGCRVRGGGCRLAGRGIGATPYTTPVCCLARSFPPGRCPLSRTDMKVFVRERLNGYYGVLTFTVANTLAGLPFIALIAVVSSS